MLGMMTEPSCMTKLLPARTCDQEASYCCIETWPRKRTSPAETSLLPLTEAWQQNSNLGARPVRFAASQGFMAWQDFKRKEENEDLLLRPA